jgi:hypothetical protein
LSYIILYIIYAYIFNTIPKINPKKTIISDNIPYEIHKIEIIHHIKKHLNHGREYLYNCERK